MAAHVPSDSWPVPTSRSLAAVPVPVATHTARQARPGSRVVAALTGTFTMPTHPIHGALRRGLLVPVPREEVVRVRVAGRPRRLRVRMGFTPAAATPHAPAAAPEAVPAGPGLLKAHLDLVDLVAKAGPDAPGVRYDLGDALTRLGFVRLAGGGFHPATVKEHLKRLAALGERRIALDDRGEEPVWRFFAEGPEGTRRPLASEADWEAVRRQGRLVAEPGAWLAACELPAHGMAVGRALLALPIDGHGHQVERLALLLAAELASWEHAEHGQRDLRGPAPYAIKRGVGTLLARAGVTELAALRQETASKGNGPKRLRAYLAGEGFADEGALALLRDQAGFDVDISDEAGFWAAGRGWLERFWDARLRLGVRGDAPAEGEGGGQPLATPPAAAAGDWAISQWVPARRRA